MFYVGCAVGVRESSLELEIGDVCSNYSQIRYTHLRENSIPIAVIGLILKHILEKIVICKKIFNAIFIRTHRPPPQKKTSLAQISFDLK